MNKIENIILHEPHIIRRKPEIEMERNIAIADLLHENEFLLVGYVGPYNLDLNIADNKLYILISGDNMLKEQKISINLQQFRSIIRDYFIICESYFSALANSDPYKLESIDMSRRAVHNEGAELFKKIIAQQIELDFDTARRLFTLICVMQAR
jgi:uncharacterized protein (UPF0262 family)